MGSKVFSRVSFDAKKLRVAIESGVESAFERATEEGARVARELNPDDTYETERSIDAQVSIKNGKIKGSIGTSSGHGVWTEIGTDEVRATKYLRKGLQRGIKVMLRELKDANA